MHIQGTWLSFRLGGRGFKSASGQTEAFHCSLQFNVFFSSPLLSSSRFRQMCQSIIAHKLFDYVVLAFIFSNCITVALERPKILQGSLVILKCLFARVCLKLQLLSAVSVQ